MSELTYLSGADLERLDFTIAEIVPHLEEMFRSKAHGAMLMPPKIFFHRGGPRFYSSMVSCAPELGHGLPAMPAANGKAAIPRMSGGACPTSRGSTS